jgi:hypothetical protein
MDKNKKREFIFWGTGLALLLGVLIFLFYSITFLINSTRKMIDKDIGDGTQITRFNLDGAEKLGLTEK